MFYHQSMGMLIFYQYYNFVYNDYGGGVEHSGARKLNSHDAKIEHLQREGCTLTR